MSLPGEEEYEEMRLSWHQTVDPRPVAVVEATSAADVQGALRVAREHDVALAVQSTGHGTLAPADGELLVRTNRLSQISIDPARRVATVGPGAVWSDVVAAAAPHGLAPISGTPAVGVTGYTLGGGAGWLSRAYGYAADSVVSADVVTSTGDLVTASADEHPDLFWALRGGSGNFGVVTRLEFRLYPVTQVYAGLSFHDIDRAVELMSFYRGWALSEPDELNTAVLVLRMPPIPAVPEPLRGKPVVGLRAFCVGDLDAAQRALAPLRDVAGPALIDGMAVLDFASATHVVGGPPPPRMAVRQHFDLFETVPDEVVDTAMTVADADSPLTAAELRHWGGAMASQVDGGPIGHRQVPFSALATAMLPGPEAMPGADAAMSRLTSRLGPHATGGSFLNFLSDPSRVASAYTSTDFRRLVELKRVLDPTNVFRANHNIKP